MWKLTALVLAMSGLAGVVHGQTPPDPAPMFEVASVRPNKSGGVNTDFGIQGDTFTASNATLRELIRIAYGAREMDVPKGQEWIESERFDIVAKAREQLRPARVPDELKPLLAERFALEVHNESREVPIYALMMARADGTLGAALQPVADRCKPIIDEAMERSRKGPPPPTPGQRMLIPPLSQLTERLVFDRTGLTGNFEIDLTWTPDRLPQGPPPPGAPPLPAFDPNGPSLFTALQEQLGLKLESERAPVEVLVIDHVERPTPD